MRAAQSYSSNTAGKYTSEYGRGVYGITILLGIIALELAVALYIGFWFVGYITDRDRNGK